MNSGKIIGLVLSAAIVLLLVFMLVQEGTTTNNTTSAQTTKVEEKKAEVQVKSEEEQKLEELKKQAIAPTNNSVSQLYSLRCKACHGSEGQGSKIGPSIKGKSAEYILGKLDDYKNNRVKNSLMQEGLLTNATQEELNTLAQEISNFK